MALIQRIAGRPYLYGATAAVLFGLGYTITAPSPRDANGKARLFWIPRTMLVSQQLRVSSVESVNHDTKRISLTLPGGDDEVSGVPPGSAVLVQHTPEGKWLPFLRPYTPISESDLPGKLRILVKRYPNGLASSYIHGLKMGDLVTMRGPIPGYSWAPPKQSSTVLFIAGGAGITPLFSLMQSVLANDQDKSSIELLWGVNSNQDIPLRKELAELQAKHSDRLKVTFVGPGLDQLSKNKPAGENAIYEEGRISRGIIEKTLQRVKKEKLNGDGKGTKVLLCGPPGMEEALTGKQDVLIGLGFTSKDIHKF